MSIEICNKCALHVDTDYDVETIVYQKNNAVCRDCAVPQCYQYKVRTSKGWEVGFLKGFSAEDLKTELFYKYKPRDSSDIKVSHYSSWSYFQKEMGNQWQGD